MAADMIQLDWGTDMATARRRLGTERRVAGNIDGRRRRLTAGPLSGVTALLF